MKFDILINQFDEHNEAGIILAKQLNIKKVIILTIGKEKIKFEDIKKLYVDLVPNIDIEELVINIGDIDKIRNIFKNYDNKNVLVNLTGGERINSLILMKVCNELDINTVYVDIINKKRYVLGNNYRVIEEDLKDIDIENILKASGANIVVNASDLCEKPEIIKGTEVILENIDMWHKYKQRLYNNDIFVHDYKDTSKVIINKDLLLEEELILVNRCVKYLKSINGIDYSEGNSKIVVQFKNNYLKGFIFKSGTWLEVITHRVVNEINGIDEVKSGVLFFWNNDAECVKNEIDVIAVKDSTLLCISCKDSDKYSEDALNELDVYSKKLGGDRAIKILVSTKPPLKKSILERAKQMDINIIVLDKDIDKFKSKIIQIIKNKEG